MLRQGLSSLLVESPYTRERVIVLGVPLVLQPNAVTWVLSITGKNLRNISGSATAMVYGFAR